MDWTEFDCEWSERELDRTKRETKRERIQRKTFGSIDLFATRIAVSTDFLCSNKMTTEMV